MLNVEEQTNTNRSGTAAAAPGVDCTKEAATAAEAIKPRGCGCRICSNGCDICGEDWAVWGPGDRVRCHQHEGVQ